MTTRFQVPAAIGLMLFVVCHGSSLEGDEQAVTTQLQRSLERFATAELWRERRGELRREFLQGAGLWPLPSRPPVRAMRHGRREYAGYSVENVALETFPGFYCTGNLYQPLGRKEIGPAILCPHGHFQPLGRFRDDQQIRCAHFARLGATVFSYSMVGWQDSRQTTHDDPRVLALQTWNSLRVVDFVSGLERVDPNRIGVTGASGGGTQAMYLTLVDERVRVSAPLVIVYPWSAPEGCRCEGGMPVMAAAQTNAIELAAAAAPRPQLLISVGNDPTRSFPRLGFPFIRKMYEIAGAPDQIQNVHLADEGHDFGPTKRKLVYEFFARHLKLTRDPFKAPAAGGLGADRSTALEQDLPPEDLATITIEKPEQMEVFNSQHPLPQDALHGSDQIARAAADYLTELRRLDAVRLAAVSVADSPLAEYTPRDTGPADEAHLFTPPGFHTVGEPRVAAGANVGRIQIAVHNAATGKTTPCRVNVVGPDGHYYQPASGDLKEFSLTGVWPKSGWGNRQGKSPARYFGRYFYCRGEAEVSVPAGAVRIEVWKGFEFAPISQTVQVSPRQSHKVSFDLTKSVDLPAVGYWSGDPHLHLPRRDANDDQRVFDLLEAEDIHFGTLLAYNEPAGPYAGFMPRMEAPQFFGVGQRSIRTRGDYSLISGQEYRSGTYGHMNLFLLDELVLTGQELNANNWPMFGHVARQARDAGGIAFHAHGGYAQEIYADVVQDRIDGVELLQFGLYRGIGLIDWYRLLNCGFRLPASGASDYPACRKLGDCLTYVHDPAGTTAKQAPGITAWLRGMAEGRSFLTTGPLLLLEVDGQLPGGQIHDSGSGPRIVTARLRARSEVSPITHLQLIANGRVVRELRVSDNAGERSWLEIEQPIELDKSAWIAGRACSYSPHGTADSEAHTNPVYIYLEGKAPYDRDSLDGIVTAIDKQISAHKGRKFPEQAQVLAYFESARDTLLKIRDAGGAQAAGHPSQIAQADPALSDPGQRTHTDEELKAFLQPVPAKPIEEVLKSFECAAGFEMQLVAREPLVVDPVAGAFDENGNLYVCEMRDYPYKPAEGGTPHGTVRLLRDTDGDGVFDKSSVFADKLLWAAGVAPWQGGVFVAAAPDIWYLKDTDGDDRADVRRRVYTGFGLQNQQGMVNNLQWGLDHWVYGSTAVNGGKILPVGDHDSQPAAEAARADGQLAPISVDGRDFRFDPRSGKFETVTGTVQFGNTFDDWGNRFLCSESQPLHHAVLPEHYLARNPHLPVPSALNNVAPGPIPVFRTSPLERWRVIRSSRRIAAGERDANVAGASHHVVDAAAGVTVYRGGAYPPEFHGQVFLGDAQNNLIHRRKLVADGITFQSERVDTGTEFVRSSDNWFRPVNFLNGPDGTLYVLDMSREILESIHVPTDVAKFLDFTSGRDRGRIYRLAPPGFRYPGSPRMGAATAKELVAELESPHGWRRETAHRLLHERQDQAAVEPLREVLQHSSLAAARLHALRSLEGLGSLSDKDLLRGQADAHPQVRRHAMQLAEPRLAQAPELLEKLIHLANDREPIVRLQAAFSLGAADDVRAVEALAALAQTAGNDRWMRTAVLSSASKTADQLFSRLIATAVSGGYDTATLSQLATVVGARNQPHSVIQLLGSAARLPPQDQASMVQALGDGLKRTGARLPTTAAASPDVSRLLHRSWESARHLAADTGADAAERQSAIELLSCFPFLQSGTALQELIDPRQPEPIQAAAVRALASYDEDQVAATLLAGWREYSPAVRKEATDAMLLRPAWTRELLQAAAAGQAPVVLADASRRTQLLQHRDTTIRALAEQLFGDAGAGSRASIVATYRSALELPRDAKRGELVFRRTCLACHKLGSEGFAVGPDLASSGVREPAVLLVHVLDPNRYVLPNYEQYVIADTDGRTYTGLIASQTATSITLRREENKTDTILRIDVESLASTGKSLMPEGMERTISQQDLANLIGFLQAIPAADPASPPRLEIGTLPGLIEP